MSNTTFRIHDLSNRDRNGDPKSYVAKCEADCHDSVDRSAYRSAVEHQDVITMGMVIVEPVA